jgi:type IV secretion system protein VirD4
MAIWAQKFIYCYFNPLEEVRVGTEWEVKNVMNIATMIVDPNGKGLMITGKKRALPC